MKKNLLSTLILLFFYFFSNAQTAKLSVQGVLRNANGTAVENGQYQLTFKLYSETEPATLIWEETMPNIDVEGGIYSVVLGSGNTPLDAEFDEPYTLGVSIEGGTELIPRAKLTSSPYALALIGNDNIFPNSGNVGVGASSPQSKLTVQRGNGVLGLEAVEDGDNIAIITSTSTGLEFDAGGSDKTYVFSDGSNNESMRINASGNVGIGTSAPQNTLHVTGDNEQIKIEGTDNSSIVFSKSSGNASLGFDISNGDNFTITNTIGNTQIYSNNINLSATNGINLNAANGTTKLIGTTQSELSFYPEGESGTPNGQIAVLGNGHMEIQSSGNVHINDYLRVGGDNVAIDPPAYFFANRDYHNENYSSGDIWEYALRVVDGWSLFDGEIHVTSDERIKKDFKLSDGQQDLDRLTKIEVTDYRYIDEMKYGTALKKGLIAQQVQSVFPEAVGKTTEFIPSIYDFPAQIVKTNGQYIFTFSKPHQLKEGDLLKFIVNNNVVKTILSEVKDEYSFSITDWNEEDDPKDTFLYGHQINDRLAVDYDEVFTLAVSATQELARKIEMLEQENTRLKVNSSQAVKSNQELKAEVETLNKRMKTLERLFEH